MKNEPRNPRIELFRDASVLQLKLLADGFRDAMLIPISIVAAIVGLVRGGENCDEEFRRVIKLGRRSERWINLFGQQQPLGVEHPAGSMDIILSQVESVVMDQYRKGKSTAEARAAVRKAMKVETGDTEEPKDS